MSHELSGACALGLSGRPVILLSTRLMAALDPDELDQIVMHEHAQLARSISVPIAVAKYRRG